MNEATIGSSRLPGAVPAALFFTLRLPAADGLGKGVLQARKSTSSGRSFHMPFKLLATLFPACCALALVLPSLSARADTPGTDLVLSGSETVEMTASDANACYFDSDNVFNGQLTDPTSGQVISINVLGSVGDHPARASDGHAQLTMLGFDSTQPDPFVNWTATGGTVTLDDIDTPVALDDGSASTHGALGHIEADLTSPQGAIHISGPFACHLAG